MPPIASATLPKPAFWLYGPLWPKPETRTKIRPGFTAARSSGPRPHFSSVPGRKFSTSRSLRRASSRTSSRPSSWRRSTVPQRLRVGVEVGDPDPAVVVDAQAEDLGVVHLGVLREHRYRELAIGLQAAVGLGQRAQD